MRHLELFLLAVSLAMDAFAVSVCKGMAVKRVQMRHALTCGVYFGVFQALMPCIGYYFGASFRHLVEPFGHWIAFGLLLLIGLNMIRESLLTEREADASFSVATMLALALATSIDALAAGVTLAITEASILTAAGCIGAVTFVLAGAGVYIGAAIGGRLAKRADLLGGVVLIVIGLKTLLTSL